MSKALRSVASFFLLFHPHLIATPPPPHFMGILSKYHPLILYRPPPILSKFEISATPPFNSTPPPPTIKHNRVNHLRVGYIVSLQHLGIRLCSD